MRVRFAPSPTGQLHIGGARTALYNWLAARHAGGTFVLRIEDTDRERSTPENTAQILEALEWLDLDWDEGPLSQAEHEPRHRAVVEQLLADGRAYRTNATADDVRAWKDEHGDDRGFRGTPEDEGAVRLRVPDSGETVIEDLIRGTTTFQNVHLDDPVIARADGSPLYNLAVAVDDLDAGITDVIRGVDHLSNTQKQVLVLEAMGEKPPRYAHLSLLHGPDGKKLSKRHGAESVQELRDKGYLPEAVRNYLALLGWSMGDDQEFFSKEQMAERFTLNRVNPNPARFDLKKCTAINGDWIRALGDDDLIDRIVPFLVEAHVIDYPPTAGQRGVLRAAVPLVQERMETLSQSAGMLAFLLVPNERFEMDVTDAQAVLSPESTVVIDAAVAALNGLDAWTTAGIEEALRTALIDGLSLKPKVAFGPVRVAVTGRRVSPPLFESIEILGKEVTIARLGAARRTI